MADILALLNLRARALPPMLANSDTVIVFCLLINWLLVLLVFAIPSNRLAVSFRARPTLEVPLLGAANCRAPILADILHVAIRPPRIGQLATVLALLL